MDSEEREIDRAWTVTECLERMELLDYHHRFHRWPKGIKPEWVIKVGTEINTDLLFGPRLIWIAAIVHEKAALAFRKHLIETWRRDRDYVPCPGDRPLEELDK